jgi:hypothetical protein
MPTFGYPSYTTRKNLVTAYTGALILAKSFARPESPSLLFVGHMDTSAVDSAEVLLSRVQKSFTSGRNTPDIFQRACQLMLRNVSAQQQGQQFEHHCNLTPWH